MNLTRAYKTVTAVFDEAEGEYPLEERVKNTFGLRHRSFETPFRVGPIEYLVSFNQYNPEVPDWGVSFRYVGMVGIERELLKYFSNLFNRKITPQDLIKLNAEFHERSANILGLGNAGEVFGTVMTIVRDFVQKENPRCVYLTAEEPKRQRLYKNMIQKGRFLPGWDLTHEVGPESFKLCNPRVQV